MPTEALINYICDLCGTSHMTLDGDKPSGWIAIEIPAEFVERSWTERIICCGCKEKIITANPSFKPTASTDDGKSQGVGAAA